MSQKVRARGLGVPFEGVPGTLNAITDVPGVRVGQTTLVQDGKPDASDAVRTGVTAIFPKARTERESVFAGWFRLNGFGELTGTPWIDEAGLLDGPIVSTNSLSIGVAISAVIEYARKHGLPADRWNAPVVGETWDGHLNDIRGAHVTRDDVLQALEMAKGGPVDEGNVGGGTGMICYEFKGGIGTASRLVGREEYHLGVLVQANCGRRPLLTVAGVPVGKEIPDERVRPEEVGSILGFVATDAPLLPQQLQRLARRCSLGLARTGSIAANQSGDLFLAFSTANEGQVEAQPTRQITALAEEGMDPLFAAVAQATEEAIVNALVAAETMVGVDHHRVLALPHARLQEALRKYGRLASTG